MNIYNNINWIGSFNWSNNWLYFNLIFIFFYIIFGVCVKIFIENVHECKLAYYPWAKNPIYPHLCGRKLQPHGQIACLISKRWGRPSQNHEITLDFKSNKCFVSLYWNSSLRTEIYMNWTKSLRTFPSAISTQRRILKTDNLWQSHIDYP